MNNVIAFIAVILLLGGGIWYYSTLPATDSSGDNMEESMNGAIASEVTVTPIEHASLVLEWDDTVVYADPVGGAELYVNVSAPDLILVTDIHGDHLSVETLTALLGDETIFVAPQAVVDQLPSELAARAVIMANGETGTQAGLSIEAIPMYNLPNQGVEIRHTEGRGNGYVLDRAGTRVYIAGDTADIPEMRNLTGIDVAFVPMNMPYTMTVDDAASGVLAFAPARVYPYHYRGQDGLADVERFKQLVNDGNPNIDVVLHDGWYPSE